MEVPDDPRLLNMALGRSLRSELGTLEQMMYRYAVDYQDTWAS